MEIIEALLYTDGQPIKIEINKGVIKRIDFPKTTSLREALYIAPGLIDNQVNGYLGVEFTSTHVTSASMRKVVRGLYKTGVTTFLPTVITAPGDLQITALSNLAKTLEDSEINHTVPGFHLEGPYISALEGYRGAHNPDYIRLPDWNEFCRLNDAANGKILQVTLAPELDGAIDFIEKCVEHGIIVSLGHHNASAAQIKKAVDAGAKIVTHLGNGCANTINRFENPIWAPLAEDRLMASLIVDGFHLRPEMVKIFYRAKRSERLILTSDVTMLGGMLPGSYTWNGKKVTLKKNGVIWYTRENCFAGASLPLITGINNIMRFTNCQLAEAVDMATKNPADLYKLEDKGAIEIGKQADLIIFTLNDGRMVIRKVYSAGQVKFDRNGKLPQE